MSVYSIVLVSLDQPSGGAWTSAAVGPTLGRRRRPSVGYGTVMGSVEDVAGRVVVVLDDALVDEPRVVLVEHVLTVVVDEEACATENVTPPGSVVGNAVELDDELDELEVLELLELLDDEVEEAPGHVVPSSSTSLSSTRARNDAIASRKTGFAGRYSVAVAPAVKPASAILLMFGSCTFDSSSVK
jgi:hypothetical protein